MSEEKKDLTKKEARFFGKMKDRAGKIVNDHQQLKELLVSTQKKMEDTDSDDSLKAKVVEFISLISRMVTGYFKGTYTETPWQTIVMFVAGLIYFITPLDAIPDFIPIAGFIDDAAILVWLGKSFRSDVARFKRWEEANDSQ